MTDLPSAKIAHLERRCALAEVAIVKLFELVRGTCAPQIAQWQFDQFAQEFEDSLRKLESEKPA